MYTQRSIFPLKRTCKGWRRFSTLLHFMLATGVFADTRYVLKDNPDAAPPFSSWGTAAPDIPSALDVAAEGDLVLVENGLYDQGTFVYDSSTNRVVIPTGVTVQSVHGPASTTLQGGTGVRCALLLGTARLIGFRLTGSEECGAVWGEGGAASLENCWLEGNSGVRGGGARGVSLSECTLRENVAFLQGGGAYDCSLQDCLLLGNSAEQGGGASASFLWNCTVTSNTASDAGGGAYDSVLRGCLVVGNSAGQGGGSAGTEGALYNCTLSGNQAGTVGGGVQGGRLFNTIVHGNVAASVSNEWDGAEMQYCLSAPLPAGTGNQTGDPLFVDFENGNFRLLPGSSCLDAGTNQTWMVSATDLDEGPRIVNEIVDLGAYEYNPPPVPDPQLILLGIHGSPIIEDAPPDVDAGTDWVARTGHSAAQTFGLTNAGNAALLLSGATFSGAGAEAFTISSLPSTVEPGASQHFQIVFQPGQALVYEAALWISHSASNTPSPFVLNVRGTGVWPVHRYVALGNPQAAAPYTNWATAAADIQSAIAVSLADDTVWVSNGIYATGSVAGLGEVLHRIAITNPIVVRSVNGPGTATIQGESGMRCAYVGANAVLAGFTLTNGLAAGGIGCAAQSSLVSNCVIAGNSSSVGGGILDGTLRNSVLADNTADSGGGAFNARLFDCELNGNSAELGGGAYDCEIDRCVFTENMASESGGGTYAGLVNNSVLRGNTAAQGGGAFGGTLNNCTLVHNSASIEGGGVYGTELLNCILADNDDNIANSTLFYCCVPQLVPGPGNIDADPLFVDPTGGNFRLATNSPCINAGNYRAWMEDSLDLTQSLRVVGPTVDMGAYEFPFTPSGIEAQWLKDHNLPWDGSADDEDPDDDLFSNWQEWRANTDPRDPASLLSLTPPPTALPSDGVGWIVRWLSSTGKWYAIDRSTNLLEHPSFQPLTDAQSVLGQSGFTTFTDRTATASQPAIYRIRLP